VTATAAANTTAMMIRTGRMATSPSIQRNPCGSAALAWPGPVSGRRRASVAAGPKRTRSGRGRPSERARLLRGRGVRQQAVARGKTPRRRTTSNPRVMSFLEPPARSMVWPTSPGAMACSWGVSCSLDASAVWRCPRAVLTVRSGLGRANERRAVALNSMSGCVEPV
jgi:hypothetical protein